LNAINVHKSLKFVAYSKPVIDNPLSSMALSIFVQCMLVLLELFRDEEPHWYEIMCFLKFHVNLNLQIDVLQELNKLNFKL
jgi:hypothetical protein